MPYMLAATVLACVSFYLNNYVIPHANQKRLNFENTYIRNKYRNSDINIHRQIKPGEYIYFESYNNFENIGSRFSYEIIKDEDYLFYHDDFFISYFFYLKNKNIQYIPPP